MSETQQHKSDRGKTDDESARWRDFAESNEESSEMEALGPDETDYVTMEVTVDVSDMNGRDTAVLMELAGLYEDNFREVYEKNRDYSWSFLKTGCNLASTDATPFETPVRSQVYGLLTRTGDKRERLKENVFGHGSGHLSRGYRDHAQRGRGGDGDARVSDPAYQTAAEAGNYWMFMAFVLSNPELASAFTDSA